MSFFELRNISKIFTADGNKFYALKNINLSFNKTGLNFICGKSGSGKSTLLNIMAMIEKPSEGDVFYCQNKIFKFRKNEINSYHNSDISLIFQHYNLFEYFDCEYNVSLPLIIKGEKKSIVEKKVKDIFSYFKLTDYLHRKVSSLSGGEKQRIAVMRALIVDPKILLCDEPTGALDTANSIMLMDLLCEIAKTRLVIVVSHNNELIKQYSDRTIYLENGIIIRDDKKATIEKPTISGAKIKKTKHHNNWETKFVKKFLKKDFKKNIMCLIASFIGLSSTLLCVGFYVGSNDSIKEYETQSLEYQYATIQEKFYQEIDGSPLNLVKAKRPVLSRLDYLIDYVPSASFELNYSSLVSSYPDLKINNKNCESSEFVPIFSLVLSDKNKKLIVDGQSPIENDLQQVIINKEFSEKYFINNSPIGQYIDISTSLDIKYPLYLEDRQYINDKFLFHQKMKIRAVVDEFSFMNQPKIYFSYVSLRDYMINYKLKEISEYLKKDFSCFDLVNEATSNSAYSSYSYNIFIQDYSNMNDFFSLINILEQNESQNLKINSSCYTISLAYNNLVTSFSFSMLIFIAVAILGVIFIFGISSFSSFIEKKKEAAILTVLGAQENDIIDIFLYENIFIGLLSALLSFAFSMPLGILFSKLLEGKFGISNIIQIPYVSLFNIPFLLPILIIILTILIITIATLIPLKSYHKFSLSQELRDE